MNLLFIDEAGNVFVRINNVDIELTGKVSQLLNRLSDKEKADLEAGKLIPLPEGYTIEIKEELIRVASNVTPFGSVSEFRKVAILKESTPSTEQETLEGYLKRNKAKREFRLVVDENGKGYIHALGQDSETLDFQL